MCTLLGHSISLLACSSVGCVQTSINRKGGTVRYKGTGFAIVGGNYNNGSLDGCFTVNLNNAVSNSNSNNGGSLYLKYQSMIDESFIYSFIALLIPYLLVKITLNKKGASSMSKVPIRKIT